MIDPNNFPDSSYFPDFIQTLNAAGFGICILDKSLRISWTNEVFTHWFEGESLENEPYHKIVLNSEEETNSTPHLAIQKNQTVSNEEYNPKHKRWFLSTSYPLEEKDHKENLVIVLLEEITERKSVLESYISQLDILDNVEDAVFSTDFDNRVVFWNRGAEKIYGHKADEIIGKIINQDFVLYQEIDSETLAQMTKELEAYRTYYFVREEFKSDGSRIWVEGNVSLVLDLKDTPIGLIYILRDITVRRNSEKLNQINALLQKDLREISSEILKESNFKKITQEIISRCSNITNSEVCLIASVENEKIELLESSNLPNSISSNTEAVSYLKEQLLYVYRWTLISRTNFICGEKDNKELCVTIKNLLKINEFLISPCTINNEIIGLFLVGGKKYEFFKNTIEVLNSFASLYAFVINYFDRKRFQELLEQKLQQSQKYETATALLSGVVHDFNNILTGIRGSVGILKEKFKQKSASEYLANVDTLLDRGTSLAKSLLNIGKPATPQKSTFHARKLTNEVIDFIRQVVPKSIAVNYKSEDELPDLNADYSQLHQVLVNICLNAKDAIEKGGTITIINKVVEYHESDYRENPKIKAGKFLKISISDTGHGISEENIPKIFDPYFTTKGNAKGTGLGLFVAYNIINSHGGFILVSSQIGKGTTFDIHLPYVFQKKQVSYKSEVKHPLKKASILLVDDEKTLRSLLAEMLTMHGYIVTEVESGEEALNIIHSRGTDIGLAILDYYLKDINGDEILRALKRQFPKLPVFVATGVIEDEIIKQLQKDGVDHIIEKPYEFEALLEKINEAIS